MKSLDAFLPAYEFATRHEVEVDAGQEEADQALRAVTYKEVPIVRGLLFARGLGIRPGHEAVLRTLVPRASVLEDAPGEGIILSLSGQFWRLRGRGAEAPATAVVDHRARPGALTTETRVHIEDPVSRRKFERYWRVVRPCSGLIRTQLLRAAKRRVEADSVDQLTEAELPDLVLPSSQGAVNVRDFDVLFVYPQTARPGRPLPPRWDEIPGARGCTPQSCGFRDHHAELAAFGVRVAGLSAQTLDDQLEFAERNGMPFPVISDEWLDLARDPGLPTFDVDGLTLYKRLALVAEQGRIVRVFYPVPSPERNAQDVLDWLVANR